MFLRAQLGQPERATSEGVPVNGYFLWSAQDNFEWMDGSATGRTDLRRLPTIPSHPAFAPFRQAIVAPPSPLPPPPTLPFPLARLRLASDPDRDGCELVPAYLAADAGGQATLAATADTLAAIALVTNAAGNFLGFGVVVPLYAVAILTTRALPRWIGRLGPRRCARWMAGTAQPGIVGDLDYLRYRLHEALGAGCQGSSTMSGLYQLIPVVGLVMLARTRRSGVFHTTQPLRSAQTQLRVTRSCQLSFE